MKAVSVEGKTIEVVEDSEQGSNSQILATDYFELKFPEGADKEFLNKLNATRKDDTPKYDKGAKDLMMQNFIMGHMKKNKDRLSLKGDFWKSYLAFKEVLNK